jgi:hypothetical protein
VPPFVAGSDLLKLDSRSRISNGGRCPNTRALQREQIDLLIALFSERKPTASPGNPLLWTGRVRRTKEPPTVNRGKTPPTDPLTPGERRTMLIAIGIFVGVIGAGSTAWAITDHSSDPYGRSGDGCVNVTFASSTGGALQHACGTAARDLCSAVSAQHNAHAEAVQAQCRVAGILP